MAPPGSDAWRHELNITGAALVLAILDDDREGATAILSTCDLNEAANIALHLAQSLVACCEPEDRPGFRETLVALLRSGALKAE
jgi:hypothetical protein